MSGPPLTESSASWDRDRRRRGPRRVEPTRHARAEGVTDNGDAATQAATMLPAELLQPGEIIVLMIKPSPLFIVLASLKSLTIIAVITLAALLLGSWFDIGLTRRDLLLLGIGAVGLRLFWQFLEWLSRVYVLTDQRVIRVRGVLTVAVFETSIQHIQHTTTVFTLRERLFGLGTIAFATAGTGVPEAVWEMVAHPLDVHQKVVQTIRRYQR